MADGDYQRYGSEHQDDPPATRLPSSSNAERDVWRASASFGWLIGAVLVVLASLLIIFLVVQLAGSSGGQRIALAAVTAVLLLLVIGMIVLLRALPRMRYRFTDDALLIEWLGQQHRLALVDISEIVFAPDIPLRLPRWEPFWPGYYVATVRTPAGTWRSWATQQPQRRVRLTTPTGIIAISPERPVRFVSELERRIQRARHGQHVPEYDITEQPSEVVDTVAALEPSTISGPRDRQPRTRRPAGTPPSSVGLWLRSYREQFRTALIGDQISSILIAAGVVLPFLMVAYLYSQYEGLPDQIPVRWNAANDVAEWSGPGGLWRFPVIAAIVLAANTAVATMLVTVDRYLARLLLAGIPLVQLILFVALIRSVN